MGFLLSCSHIMNVASLSIHTVRKLPGVLLFLWCVCVLVPVRLSAQVEEKEQSYELAVISFSGNRVFSKSALLDVMQLRESPAFFSRMFYAISWGKLGAKPMLFDETILDDDIKRLQTFYQNHSYFRTTITPSVTYDTAEATCSVLLTVVEGNRSLIDSIVYEGLDQLSDELKRDIFSEPLVQLGTPYEPVKSQAEIARITNFLSEVGYPQVRLEKDRSGAFHYASTNNFKLIFAFSLGRYYQYGEATVHIDPPREDITPELVLRHLDYAKGEQYSKQKTISSERNLNRLDLFEAVRIETPQLSDSLPSMYIPTDIYLKPRDRHEISPEVSASDENNTFNLGLGVGYTSRNFFGDARLLTARARVRAQSLPEWNLGDVVGKGHWLSDPSVTGAVELQFQVIQPYIFSRKLTGSWTFSVSSEKQNIYTLASLRNKIGFSNQFATYTYGLAEWTLERVIPEVDSGGGQLPTKLAQEENQKQFNSILTLSLQRDRTNDIFSPTEGFFNSISAEESGVLPKLLPSLTGDLPFTQYFKVVLFGRWYKDLSDTKTNIIAFKARAGLQEKYGESKSSAVNIPLNRRFFAGGSGSVRGWRARDLGAMPDERLPLGGNFIYETNVELRVNHFRGMGKFLWLESDNIWMVYFADVGNVWEDVKRFRLSDLAAATGFGFRYDTYFGPFRIDYGFRLYDPKAPAGKQTIFQKRFWAETFSNGAIHFGIGHAF